MRVPREMSILPPGMDGRHNASIGQNNGLPDWQINAADTVPRSTGDPTQRSRPAPNSIRAVTPEPSGHVDENGGMSSARSVGYPTTVSTSPRAIAIRGKPRERRDGLVFQDSFSTETLEPSRAGPPVSFRSRTRTRTMDEPSRQRSTSTSMSKSRHRIGSVHSASSSFHDVEPRQDVSSAHGFSSSISKASPQLRKSPSIKGTRRLVKRPSRPTSPLSTMSDVPSVDSLPFPVVTGDANKILILMKTLCGRMKGNVEYQNASEYGWNEGVCYIDDTKGSLMYEGDDRGPFHIIVISDLRGCRVRPMFSKERKCAYLEISNPTSSVELRLLPMVDVEFDLWLAALLSWQQIRNGTLQASSPKVASREERRPSVQSVQSVHSTKRRDSAFGLKDGNSKEANIIKVAKIQLWDKGAPTSPRSIVRRPSTRDLRSSSTRSWRRVSCILQDNGEFKLLTENDVTLLSVIQLSQLSRSAIQRLDRSVLDEEFCIAIFPQYTPSATQLSIFRPVYIALESRILFEVWFCLLRSFSIPEIYGPDDPSSPGGQEYSGENANDLFRMEKALTLRVVEAKLRKPTAKTETISTGRAPTQTELDNSVGDYFVEVILDGEIRARTMTKTETRNPFWREDCEFNDLPAHLPKLSFNVKKIQHPDVAIHGFLSSSSVFAPDPPQELLFGSVDIQIEKLEKGKDSEIWYPILDNQEEKIGEIFLKIRHDELVVLLAKDYREISELLHRFNNGLTIQIADAIPTNLRKLSEILLNIFQVSGHATEWLRSLAEDEIDGIAKELPVPRVRYNRRNNSNESTISERELAVRDMSKSLHGEANLLFRGNSLLTQALDFHMRRLGKEYLEDVLLEKIVNINRLNPHCEVDPSRISHGEDINKNWTQLISLTTDIWESIAGSAQKCPPDLRQVLKYIRAVAEDRYGDFLRTVAYTSVSGFLFLRFFCPALLNPKLFGLLRDHPPAKAQRTLTLIAKSLQALANLSTFGQKEVWMEPMNKFLTSNRAGVKSYINNITNLLSERQTFALPASYSTPITILARLPPTSREGFPSLPYLIDHARNFAALIKLWLDAFSTNEVELEGDLETFHNLCAKLQSRTDECLRKAEGEREADHLTLQWQDMVAGLAHSAIGKHEELTIDTMQRPNLVLSPDILSDTETRPDIEAPNPNPPAWSEYSASVTAGTPSRGPPGSSGSEVRKERQSFWDFGKDGRSHHSKTLDLSDAAQASPPSSRNGANAGGGGKPRGFFRRKGKEGKEEGLWEKEKEKERDNKNFAPGASYGGL